ncbi:MAG: hypothetical protein GXP63_07725 [DPANN group archaeon]|nr:hypothetical protein [DPANN group archaeon]
MGIFGKGRKKQEEADTDADDLEGLDDDEQYLDDDTKAAGAEEMNLSVEITRIKAQLEALGELRKNTQERFGRISEQIGELRGMIMDTNKSLQQIEVRVIKSVDMVESVQPDKLLIEVKRQDAKIEGLSAKIEGNRSFIDTLLEDIKELRRIISTFKGIEETVKMNQDVKKELNAMEKMKAIVERHADKAETLFIEIQKKVTDFDAMDAKVKDLDKGMNSLLQEFDVVKVKFSNKAEKKEIEDLIAKFDKFEKHYGKVVELLSDQTTDLKSYFKDKIERRFAEAGTIRKMLIDLIRDQPNLEKNMKAISELAEEASREEERGDEETQEGGKAAGKEKAKTGKKGFFGKLKSSLAGKKAEEEVVIPDNIGAGDDKPVD